jgi:hypothetical protein
MNVSEESKALLEALCVKADPRKARSLRLIHAVCEEQRDRGSTDYSIVTIGRLSAELGGPAAGAIRNKTGEVYRAIIKVFADSRAKKRPKAANSSSTQADLILEGVTDPVLRARIGLLVAELKSTRAQLLAARHVANQSAVLDLAQLPSDGSQPHPAPRLSAMELLALENAISDVTLTHWGWRIDNSGRIVTDTGQTVFAAGFVTAVDKVLQSHRPGNVQDMTIIEPVC